MKKIFLLMILSVFTASVFAVDLTDKYPGGDDVHLVKGKKQKQEINKKLEQVDVAFEMGDGYYDVQSIKLYVVRSGNDVIGYIEEYELSYTEEPELVTVVVRYGVDGKRIGEIEEIDRVIVN